MVTKGPTSTKTATNAKVTHAPAAPKILIDEPIIWATAVLVEMNRLSKSKRKIPITVNNVETLLRPITGEGSMGQSGGFLRDNNPWNIGTGCSPTGAYGGTPKAPFGPDSRCGGGPVYLNTFATPLEGIKATAQYLLDNHAAPALTNNAPSSLVLSKTWYKGDANAQTAVPVKAAEVAAAAHKLGSSLSNIAGGAVPGKVDVTIKNEILAVAKKGGKWPASLNHAFLRLNYADQQATLQAVRSDLAGQGVTSGHDYLTTVKGLVDAGLTTGADLLDPAFALGKGGAVTTSNVVKGGPLPNPLSGLEAIGHFFTDLTSLDFWKRVGMGVLGVGLVVGGVVIFLQSTKTVQGIEGKVVP